MKYFYTKYGTIVDENMTPIPMAEGNPIYEEYLLFLQADGTIEQTDYVTNEELEELRRTAVPLEVSLWKLKFVLQQMGLEQSVIDAINQMPDPTKTAALYLWNYGTAVDRYSATVDLIKQSVGLSDRQVDDIFIQANSIIL